MIRKFNDEDADAVVSTWRAASELAHPFLTREFLDREADAVRNVYLVYAETWVTEVDGEVVGFIALVDDEIGGLFLHPRLHGQGFGKAMVDEAVAEKGPLRVEVFEKNEIGRRFYDTYGFSRSGEFVHEPTGECVIRMAFTPQ
ncbi:MAG: putative acetyltransferase [Alphaproteobacteria bacterium]|jgi:putative acetyltransferase